MVVQGDKKITNMVRHKKNSNKNNELTICDCFVKDKGGIKSAQSAFLGTAYRGFETPPHFETHSLHLPNNNTNSKQTQRMASLS